MTSKSILSLTIASLLLTSCGGGGSNSKNTSDSSTETAPIETGSNTTKPNEENPTIPPEDNPVVAAENSDIDDMNCAIDGAETYTGNVDDVSQSLNSFKSFLNIQPSNSLQSLNSGVFGFVGGDVYAFDAYMGKDVGSNEWRSTVPEDIVSIKINTDSSGSNQNIKYTNFLNLSEGLPHHRKSEKVLTQTTFDPCHGYSESSTVSPFVTAKKIKISQRYDDVSKKVMVAYQEEGSVGSFNNALKYYVIYDVVDVSGKLISDYVPNQILDLARYAVSRFSAYAKISYFPTGSVFLRTNMVLIPEHYTGFKMDKVEYFSETFDSIEKFNSFIKSLSLTSSAIASTEPAFELHYSSNTNSSKFIKTIDFNRSEALFVNGGKYHAASHQPFMIYKPDYNIDTSELGRSYYNSVAGNAINNLMLKHIYDDR